MKEEYVRYPNHAFFQKKKRAHTLPRTESTMSACEGRPIFYIKSKLWIYIVNEKAMKNENKY